MNIEELYNELSITTIFACKAQHDYKQIIILLYRITPYNPLAGSINNDISISAGEIMA